MRRFCLLASVLWRLSSGLSTFFCRPSELSAWTRLRLLRAAPASLVVSTRRRNWADDSLAEEDEEPSRPPTVHVVPVVVSDAAPSDSLTACFLPLPVCHIHCPYLHTTASIYLICVALR